MTKAAPRWIPPQHGDPLDIVGLRIKALLGQVDRKRTKYAKTVDYIMFDDGETYIRLDTQCSITYHDCDPGARTMQVMKGKMMWERLMEDDKLKPLNPKHTTFGWGW